MSKFKSWFLECIDNFKIKFVVGHITPEAYDGGTIALVNDGDIIEIDAVNNILHLAISDQELENRKQKFISPEPPVTSGVFPASVIY